MEYAYVEIMVAAPPTQPPIPKTKIEKAKQWASPFNI